MAEDTTHRYRAECHWNGSTGLGYEHYDRAHDGLAPPATSPVGLSSDLAFRGDPHLLNPEQLIVLAASSCQLLSFLAVAARARIDVIGYVDAAEGLMPADADPMRITLIELRPTIRIRSGPTEERVRHLIEIAHRECYVSNTLNCEITVVATIDLI